MGCCRSGLWSRCGAIGSAVLVVVSEVVRLVGDEALTEGAAGRRWTLDGKVVMRWYPGLGEDSGW